eukprot:5076104-Pleurochrysis_carterae.AAC.1
MCIRDSPRPPPPPNMTFTDSLAHMLATFSLALSLQVVPIAAVLTPNQFEAEVCVLLHALACTDACAH